MTNPNWLHGYAATTSGAHLREALIEDQVIDVGELPDGAHEYRERWEALQFRVVSGSKVPRDGLRTVGRSLVDDAQADSVATGRVDLHEALRALTSLPGGAGDFFHELLASEPDRKKLQRLSAPFHGSTSFEESSRQSTATLYFVGGGDWAEAIGGEWTTERMRKVTVSCRYAKWRDRRVRRLCRIQVDAVDAAPAE